MLASSGSGTKKRSFSLSGVSRLTTPWPALAVSPTRKNTSSMRPAAGAFSCRRDRRHSASASAALRASTSFSAATILSMRAGSRAFGQARLVFGDVAAVG